MFSIVWTYLNGVSHAADYSDQARAEWPPHPDRVYQSLVASWAARGFSEEEREALCWLESLDPPDISIPPESISPSATAPAPHTHVPPHNIEPPIDVWHLGRYVDSYTGILPDKRARKRRQSARQWVGDGLCALTWHSEESLFLHHREALHSLCHGVTRIGRSSACVACWITTETIPAYVTPDPRPREGALWMRVPHVGRLSGLQKACQQGARPERTREESYRVIGDPVQDSSTDDAARTAHRLRIPFSTRPIVFRLERESPLYLSDTLSLTNAFRKILIAGSRRSHAGLLPLVSGHAPDGSPLETTHAAYVPLPFVGHEHADGRLLGLAVFLPVNIDGTVTRWLFRLFAELADPSGALTVTLPDRRTIRLCSDIATDMTPLTLRPTTWTRESRRWASVTPVVMDRMQNRRRSDPDGWAADQVSRMLSRDGFAKPFSITVSPVSRCRSGLSVFDAPPIVRKDRRVRRMVHVEIEFERPQPGPIIIGSGRYRGYGLCKPARESRATCSR